MNRSEMITEIKHRQRYLDNKIQGLTKMKKSELEKTLHAIQIEGLLKSLREDCSYMDRSRRDGLYLRVFNALYNEHKFTLEQLEQCSVSNMKVESKSDEYISRSCNASVWSTYGSGSIEILGETFMVKSVFLSSDARAL